MASPTMISFSKGKQRTGRIIAMAVSLRTPSNQHPCCSTTVTHGLKKEGNPLFDVSVGSYNGAEVCELVRFYLLGKLTPLIGTKNVGLYRDDGLAVIHQANGPKMDRISTYANFWKSNAGETRIQRASQPITLKPLSGVQGQKTLKAFVI